MGGASCGDVASVTASMLRSCGFKTQQIALLEILCQYDVRYSLKIRILITTRYAIMEGFFFLYYALLFSIFLFIQICILIICVVSEFFNTCLLYFTD